MIVLYHSSGAQDFELLNPLYDKTELNNLIFNVKQVLKRRGYIEAAEVLISTDFEVWKATNSFSDEFSVIYVEVPLDKYESFRISVAHVVSDFAKIAEIFTELDTFIRFIACELELQRTSAAVASFQLSMGEILKLVNEYIGVHGGYLGDFLVSKRVIPGDAG